MEFSQLIQKALQVKAAYTASNQAAGYQKWDTHAYTTGLNGDVGDLNKIVGARYNYRQPKGDIRQDLAHELNDIIWSVLCIAHEEDIDIEQTFISSMDEILSRPDLAPYANTSDKEE